jgi:hypothetical protein
MYLARIAAGLEIRRKDKANLGESECIEDLSCFLPRSMVVLCLVAGQSRFCWISSSPEAAEDSHLEYFQCRVFWRLEAVSQRTALTDPRCHGSRWLREATLDSLAFGQYYHDPFQAFSDKDLITSTHSL